MSFVFFSAVVSLDEEEEEEEEEGRRSGFEFELVVLPSVFAEEKLIEG